MAATWKDAESVAYWINGIGRGMNFPFPQDPEQKKQLQRELYPKMIEQGVHSDFVKEMEDYLDFGTFGNIRFRFSDYYEFKKVVREIFRDWLLENYEHSVFPRQSYFIMHRNMDELSIKKQGYKIVFSIQDNNDKYPVVIRMSEKQLFLLKPLLEQNNLDPLLINRPLPDLEKALKGVSFCVLKYLHCYNEDKKRPVYWTYSMLSPSADALKASFVKSVEGNFVPNFHPDALPKPLLTNKNGNTSSLPSQLHIHKKGKLKIHRNKTRVFLSFKNELIGVVHKDRFQWLCSPRLALIPFVEQVLNLRAAS